MELWRKRVHKEAKINSITTKIHLPAKTPIVITPVDYTYPGSHPRLRMAYGPRQDSLLESRLASPKFISVGNGWLKRYLTKAEMASYITERLLKG